METLPENPFESLENSMLNREYEYSQDRKLAWVYGIVCGWDKEPDPENPDDPYRPDMDYIAREFQWDEKTVERLRRLHSKFSLMKETCESNPCKN